MTEAQRVEFSLCAIYRNEENMMADFIRHIAPLVSEMVLVDTGSSDRSNEIVADFGLKYFNFPWNNDFSAARNFSLSKATRSFIIVLDIDERINSEDFRRLKALIREKRLDAYSLRQINFSDDAQDIRWRSVSLLPKEYQHFATGFVASPLIRVFRNVPGIHFRGTIHEIVGDSIRELNLSSMITDIPIYHLGWIKGPVSSEEQIRKKKIYQEMIRQRWETEKSAQAGFYYLTTMEDGQEKIRLSYQLTRTFPSVPQFWVTLAQTCLAMQQATRALAYLEKGLRHHPQDESLMLLKACALNETGHPETALAIIETLLRHDPNHPRYCLEKLRALILARRNEEAREFSLHLPPGFPEQIAKDLIKLISP